MANVLTVPLHSATLLHCHGPAHQGRLLDILLKTIPQLTFSTLDRRRLWTQLWFIHDQSAHFRLPVHSGNGSTDNFGRLRGQCMDREFVLFAPSAIVRVSTL
jgi:hypothetical protein